jgi:hypothetical protein
MAPCFAYLAQQVSHKDAFLSPLPQRLPTCFSSFYLILDTDKALLGYPGASLPLGYLDFNGRPFGLQIIAKAHQEALQIQAQSAWETTFPKRQPPPLDEIVW